jgi:5-formyltetrahydrofolate cyclo-ligase
MRDELDLWEMAGEALASGRRLALPRFARERQEYEAAWVRDLEREVVEGAFGIREPAPACPAFPLNRLDFSAVPGLGFDASGRRLGRGKGYYDRLLTGVTGVTCGVGYDFQVVDAVPCGPLDVVLNCILTPTRWFRASLRADL